ncbi:MAG: DUF1015 domain-containing protein [Chitinophagales bacterium]|nr:DUF1015 domain-containing protein [Chitinophagales bacterium]
MAHIRPFRALRPQQQLVEQVATLPYDVMNTAEAKAMAEGNPNSFLHVSRAEIDLPEEVDIHSTTVYAKANENFRKLIADGVLIQEEKPCYYIYAQTMNGRRQFGIAACSSIDDYFSDIIKKHEYTRPEKELDRIQHMEAVQAHVGPIFLTYPTNNTIKEIVETVTSATSPTYDFTAVDDVTHQLWVINEDALIQKISTVFSLEIPFTYIADGHHRAASAAKVGLKLRENGGNTTDEYNYFLSVLFPSDELAIMDYNRLVKDLNGHSVAEFLDKIKLNFEMSNISDIEAKPEQPNQFGMYLDGQWYRLTAKSNIVKSDPIGILDVTILQENILSPLLNINDPRTDTRIDFVGGIRGLGELKKRVDSGEHQIAFALYPVSLEQLIAIADSGNVMPPKSTWFEPKLRDGLLCHLF